MQSLAALALLGTLALPQAKHDAPSQRPPPEWGGFRGNNGCGLAAAARLPDAFDREKNQAWRAEIPRGYSSPVVAGEMIFLTAAAGTELSTLCIARDTGERVWTRTLEFDGKRVGGNSSAAPTPATDGERLFVLFHSAGLVAYDLAGLELWRAPLGPFNIPHGMSSSPVLFEDLVLLQVDQDTGSYLLALEAATGKERWKVDRPRALHGYSTPAVYRPKSGPAQLVASGSYQIAGYSLADGKQLWWVDGASWQAKAVPVLAEGFCIVNTFMPPSAEFGLPNDLPAWDAFQAEHDADKDQKIARHEWDHEMMQQVWFIVDLDGDDTLDQRDYEYLTTTGTATGGLFAIRLDGQGDVSKSHVAWKVEERRGLPDAPSPILVGNTLFLIKEGSILTALDAKTGTVTKQGRVGEPDEYFASPVAAGGRLLLASKGGQLAVVTAEPQWDVVSTQQLDEEVWATPAIAGNDVLVRTNGALYCFRPEE
jgi:outer membrane protein assembly factor BamB